MKNHFKGMRIVFSLTVAVIIMISCSPKQVTTAAKVLESMNLDKKIGQMIMVGVSGNNFSDDTRSMIKKMHPGGIILFGYNISSGVKSAQFIEAMQRTSLEFSGIPLFISLDQEGGRVKRIIDGVTQFPGNMAMGVVSDDDLVYDAARILGMQLRRIGVNMNLAPVLDVNNNPDNPVINTRSFGSDPSIVAEMGKSYIKGIQRSRCIAVGKHFPGHGDTDKDSHLTLPVINYDMKRLEKIELLPFREAIDAGVESIMTAHIAYPAVLKKPVPATLSEKMLTGLLREEMQFEGVIITDDLEMDAISKMMDIGDAAVETVKAGSDIVLISSAGENARKIAAALNKAVADGSIPEKRIDESVLRILELKLRYNIMRLSGSEVKQDRPEYSRWDRVLRRKADKVNLRISRAALYYHGVVTDVDIPLLPRDARRVVFSANSVFRSEIAKDAQRPVIFANSEYELMRYITEKGKQKLAVIYHVEKIFNGQLEFIRSLSRQEGIHLIVVSSDNPFPLSKIDPLPRSLFTFSNTDESLRQAARCLNGGFLPRREINFHLGIH